MKRWIMVLVGCMAIGMAATPCFARIQPQNTSGSFFFGGYTFDSDEELKDAYVMGIRLGYDFTQILGIEGTFDYAPTKSKGDDTDANVYGYRLDGLLHIMPDGKFVPFIAAGVGGRALQYQEQGHDRNHFLANYGIGAKYFLTDNFVIRADVRHLILFNETLNNFEYTLGIGFNGGAKKPAPKIIMDSDNDGVPDDQDLCPGTPYGVAVDSNGCPLDSDKDGVPDYLDKCPDTPAGVKVDKDGCPLDSDKDGIPDYLDKCPDTPRGVQVDENGCPPPAPVIIPEAPTAIEKAIVEKGRATLNVEFKFNKADIQAKSHEELERFAAVMQKYPDLKVTIEGHTDNVGGAKYNEKLSQKRAESVKKYLVDRFGIAASRLTAKGYGLTKPIADNKTAAGRQKNRRVEAVTEYEFTK